MILVMLLMCDGVNCIEGEIVGVVSHDEYLSWCGVT